MPKIWNGGASEDADPDLNRLMVDEDIRVDSRLLKYELLTLMAYHIQMSKQNIIPASDSANIARSLLEIYNNPITLDADLEDVHGNVEEQVMKNAGKSGENLRIFLSRNEQSHSDIVLYKRDMLIEIADLCLRIAASIKDRREETNGLMPGYTHYRQGMVISAATYMDYVSSIFLDLAEKSISKAEQAVVLPFGYGSGFGPLTNVDFNGVASLLGMTRPDANPMFLASKRGMDEIDLLFFLSEIMINFSRISQDLIIFSSDDLPLFALPSGFTTGSSLMANKRNPDFLEMVQGYTAQVMGHLNSALMIVINKSSGYHRDFQLTKKFAINSLETVYEILEKSIIFFKGLTFNTEFSRSVIKNSSYATANALTRFQSGMTWKEAYTSVGEAVRNGERLQDMPPSEFLTVTDGKINDLSNRISSVRKNIKDCVNRIIRDTESLSHF